MLADRTPLVAGIAAALLLCLPGDSSSSSFTFGPSGGTTGIGLEATVGLGQNAGLRFSHGLMGMRTDLAYHGIPYSFDASLDWLGAFIDLYPSGGPFRLSAGALAVTGDVDVAVTLDQPVSVGGVTYSPEQLGSVTGTVHMDPVAAYLGMGWDSRRTGILGLSLDLGVAFQQYDLELHQEGGTLPVELQQILGVGVEEERHSLEDKLNSLGMYPVVRAGLSLNF
jgi:hypothetical protein